MFGLRRKSYRGRAPNPLLGKSTNPLLGKSQNPLLMKRSYQAKKEYVLSKYTLGLEKTDQEKWETAISKWKKQSLISNKPPNDCVTESKNLNVDPLLLDKFDYLIREMYKWGVQIKFPNEFLDSIVFGKFGMASGFWKWVSPLTNGETLSPPEIFPMKGNVVLGKSIGEQDTLRIVDIYLILLSDDIFEKFLKNDIYTDKNKTGLVDSGPAPWYSHYFSSLLQADATLTKETAVVIHELMHAWVSYTGCFIAEDRGDSAILSDGQSQSAETLASMLTNIFIKAAEISKTSNATKKMALKGSMAMIIDALMQVKKSVDKNALDVVDLYIKLSPEKYDSISWDKNDSYKTNLDNEKFPNLTQEDKAKLEGQSIRSCFETKVA